MKIIHLESSSLAEYQCKVCRALHQYIITDPNDYYLNELTFQAIKIKDTKFEIKFHFGPQMTTVYHFFWVTVDSPDGPYRHQVRRVFHTFDHIVGWTPLNARDKLKLLLPFF